MPLPEHKVDADIARKTMNDFAQRTGIDEDTGDSSQRYLWTDAFAVQSFFGLSHIYAFMRLIKTLTDPLISLNWFMTI